MMSLFTKDKGNSNKEDDDLADAWGSKQPKQLRIVLYE